MLHKGIKEVSDWTLQNHLLIIEWNILGEEISQITGVIFNQLSIGVQTLRSTDPRYFGNSEMGDRLAIDMG